MMPPMPRPSPWNEQCTPEKLWMLTHLVDAGPAACWLALDQAHGDVHAAAARLITPAQIERYATQLGLRPINLLPIGEDWIVLPADQARERLGVVLAQDQAHDGMQMDLTNGRRFADRFAALLPVVLT